MTPSQILHARNGSAASPICGDLSSFRCWVCAGTAVRGVHRDDWMGSNFTGQNRVRYPDSNHVCEACAVVMAGKPPHTERMYSHFVDGDSYLRVNKGAKPAMRAWLRRPHAEFSFAAIADSGQKHIIPWSPMNGAGLIRRVTLEDRDVTIGDWALVDELAELLTLGATKEETGRGEFGARAWKLCGAELRTFEARWRGLRGGGWFELALWLAQRDEARVADRQAAEATAKKEKTHVERGRKRAAPKQDRRGAVGVAKHVPTAAAQERPQALGDVAGPHAGSGAHHIESGGVGDGHGAVTEGGVGQLALFDGAAKPGGRRARA